MSLAQIGIIADLAYGPVTVSNGYVEISHIKGGPNFQPEGYPHVTGGQWLAFVSWYASLEIRQADINSFIPLGALPGINPRDYLQFPFPYVIGVDPYQTAIGILQMWFPTGTVTTPFVEEAPPTPPTPEE